MRLRREHIAIIAAALIGAGAGAFLLFEAGPRRAPVPAPALAPGPAPVAAPHQPNVPTAIALPRLERIDCWFAMPPGRSARCGSLLVAEQAGSDAGRALRLRFVVFPGKEGTQAADPVIYISGGPGEPAQIDAATIARWWSWIARAPWLAEREIVVFDQRGVGVSEPQMNCPEIADAGYRIFPQALAEADEARLWTDAARRCHDRLVASGLDLAQYNTKAIVADLRALIGELGFRRWNLFAVSYGTRVALEFLRDNAAGTRGVVLDSTYPPEARSYVDGPRNGARAFEELFRECAADAHCDAAFPRLAESFERVVRRAIATPLDLTLADPRTGQPVPVKLDGARLVETLFYGLYEWRETQQMPALIAALDRGDAQPLLPLAAAAFATYASVKESHGLYLSVECHDEFPFNDRAAVARAAAEMPLFKDFALTTLPLMACPGWPVGSAAAAEREAVSSDVPILLLAGELDPVVSPDWAKEAAQLLPHASLIRFRGIGHGVVAAHACADLLIARFLADPAKPPYDDCLLAIGTPQFTRATLGP
jgi:pimeloyl-ACP methyl ester carboxylesterase